MGQGNSTVGSRTRSVACDVTNRRREAVLAVVDEGGSFPYEEEARATEKDQNNIYDTNLEVSVTLLI